MAPWKQHQSWLHALAAAPGEINWRGLLLCWLLLLAPGRVSAALQFDVFLGYDGVVREAGWFPLMCEILNDGPAFNGVIEVGTGTLTSEQVKRVPVELPTNTRKRVVIPVFASGGRFAQWNARLVDDKGKERSARPSLQPKALAWEGLLLGAVPRAFAGMPTLPEAEINRPEIKPQVARFAPEQLPDNPIAFEGLNALYLNSERALALKVNQVGALLAWVRGGGHLIVGVEQPGDVNATPWLQELLPMELTDAVNVTIGEELQDWLKRAPATTNPQGPMLAPTPNRQGRKNLNMNMSQVMVATSNPYAELLPDPAVGGMQAQLVAGTVRNGTVELALDGKPAIVKAAHGRGEVTLLTFSPEREPFRSWKNKSWFWARLMNARADQIGAPVNPAFGGTSLDGVIGALIDSRQVRKLPVEWLLLLLVVYLIVIGPFDQWFLKRINRQMLTWITFPSYVVLFSLLIYFIGYKLRAGDTEWNELNMVDVMPRGEGKSELRGRTFASIYSSGNADYNLTGEQTFSCLRGELLDLFGGGKEGSKASVEQRGNNFQAVISVPVWTSLLYVNDWFQPANTPLSATIEANGQGWSLGLENFLDRPLKEIRVAIGNQLYEVDGIEAKSKKTLQLEPAKGTPLQAALQQHGNTFKMAAEQRRNPVGDSAMGQLENWPLTASMASFADKLGRDPNQRGFIAPAGMDLSPQLERGDAVILAWDPDHSLVKPMNQFTPPRLRRHTLLRLCVPAKKI